MSYRITIQRIEEKRRVERGDWTIVDKRPLTKEELITGDARCGAGSAIPLKDVYGYAPDREVTKVEETKIYEQTIDDTLFDRAKIVRAVNGLT